jgi:hypothetical protein
MMASENICKFEEDEKSLWGTKYFFCEGEREIGENPYSAKPAKYLIDTYTNLKGDPTPGVTFGFSFISSACGSM